jgi:tetratricopeptide (TPR) repeat protein
LQIAPDDFRAYYNRGLARMAEGNYQEAIADYSKAIEIAQVTDSAESSSAIYSDIYTDRGIAKFMSTDVSAAIADFSQAIELDRLNARAFFNRGCAHHRQRFLVQAIADFTTSLQLDPHNPDAYMGRAIALHNQGSDREALQDLQIAAREFLTKGEDDSSRRALDLWHQLQQKTIFT